MPHWFHAALRVLAGIAGALSLYSALFLYEDEQGRIENKLEGWWVKLDDRRNAAVTRHTAFMRETARVLGQGFDRLFGKKLISLQAFGVSSALTMTAVWANQVFIACKLVNTGRLEPWSFWVGGIQFSLISTAASIFCVLAPITGGNKRPRVVPFVPLVWTTLVYSMSETGALLLSTTASFACDLLFIAATRRLLRWSSSMERFSEIAGVILLNIFMAIALIAGPNSLSNSHTWLGDTLGWLAIANVVDGVVASVFILLALTMLAHRLFWPLVNRPLYILHERGVRRGVFAMIAVALIAYAGVDMPELIRQLIEKGAG